MPDVIVIGGGMIGATTAWQLAERGAEVLLLERGHLASGATRRSQGLLLEPEVDPMQPLFAESNRLVRPPRRHAPASTWRSTGSRSARCSWPPARPSWSAWARTCPADGRCSTATACSRPSRAWLPTVSGGLLMPGGRRTDPAALTAAAAEMARRAGAEIRCHVDVKRVAPGSVVTDGGFERAGTVVHRRRRLVAAARTDRRT